MMRRLGVPFRLFLPALLLSAGPSIAHAQQRGEWNAPRVMELVRQATELRQETAVDSAFQAYRADARGYVYFFLDRPDVEDRTLVKTDQLALEVYWKAPDRTRQRIVGMRDRKELPTNIRYHLDHLTVVQDDFDDRIRLGDGDEVSAVVHPVAPRAPDIYDYRLTDSLGIRLGGGDVDEIRVYEVQVRPRDLDAPGIIGSVFLQRGTGAIVRMSFTFTPSSYVDENLDYIRISLDNSVWDGKYWLPYRQEAELRRELPALDFLAGSVIRGRFEIRGYDINPDLPDFLFRGPRVTAVTARAREAFPFEEGIYAQIDEEGLGETPNLEAIRDQAYAVVGRRYLSGLSPSRLWVPAISSLYRYDRAEGSFAGAGLSFQPDATSRVRTSFGYAFGRGTPSVGLEWTRAPAVDGPRLRIDWNRLEDIDPTPGSSGALNTLSSLIDETDYLDPFFRTGVSAGYRHRFGTSSWFDIEGGWDRIRSAEDVVSDVPGATGFRPVLPIREGDGAHVTLGLGTGWGALSLDGSVQAGRFDEGGYVHARSALRYEREIRERGLTVRGSIEGVLNYDVLDHHLVLIGGRHTLMGHAYRAFVGDRLALLRLELSQTVAAPWLNLRAFGAAGITGVDGEIPAGWPTTTTDGVLGSIGLGVGLGWDVLRFDVGHGLGEGGDWEFVLSTRKRFWPWL